MSEIRKALALIKRVDTIEDAPARRMALELGALACDRGELAAQRAQKLGEGFGERSWSDFGDDDGGGGRCRHGGGSGADLGGGNGWYGRGRTELRKDVGDATRLIAATDQGEGEKSIVHLSLSLHCLSVSPSLVDRGCVLAQAKGHTETRGRWISAPTHSLDSLPRACHRHLRA